MRISACNQFDATVASIKRGKATTDLRLESPVGPLAVVLTSSSVEVLDLAEGDAVAAYFREIDVMLIAGTGAISTKNRFPARVLGITTGNVTAELPLELVGGRRIIAVVARAAAEEMGLGVGSQVVACVREGDLILAKNGQLSIRNSVAASIASLRPGTVTTEITLDSTGGNGAPLQALLARSTADAMELAVGDRVIAVLRERDVLIAR